MGDFGVTGSEGLGYGQETGIGIAADRGFKKGHGVLGALCAGFLDDCFGLWSLLLLVMSSTILRGPTSQTNG